MNIDIRRHVKVIKLLLIPTVAMCAVLHCRGIHLINVRVTVLTIVVLVEADSVVFNETASANTENDCDLHLCLRCLFDTGLAWATRTIILY